MRYYKAKELIQLLSETYLFSGIMAFAVDNEDDANEDILKIFESIEAIGIGEISNDGYCLNIYHSKRLKDKRLIADFFKLEEWEVNYLLCEPFEFLSSKNRPLTIGSAISHIDSDYFGTLGCFVKNKAGKVYILSNHHVLYNAASSYKDDFIIQPAKVHGGTNEDSIAVVSDRLPYDPRDINEFDAALAGPIGTAIDLVLPEFDSNRKIDGVGESAIGQKVFKYGAVTGLTFGVVGSFVTSVRVMVDGIAIAFRNQIVVNGLKKDFGTPATFCAHGDSGSVIIDYDLSKACGLLFAGSKNGTYGLCNPISDVLNRLGVAILKN
jgi:hypothetical protein